MFLHLSVILIRGRVCITVRVVVVVGHAWLGVFVTGEVMHDFKVCMAGACMASRHACL